MPLSNAPLWKIFSHLVKRLMYEFKYLFSLFVLSFTSNYVFAALTEDHNEDIEKNDWHIYFNSFCLFSPLVIFTDFSKKLTQRLKKK